MMDPLYTREEVAEAMEMLRHYRSSIPMECLDQMETVLYNAISDCQNDRKELE